ncbi:hypothetical protein ABZ686_10835 [Streptomyces sp. NPDC006992]|uniref:hypothetical protein n=1 Tax=Streptomyces sp. NPDC006992 TaxID=3155601 RepID=UPI0033CA3234
MAQRPPRLPTAPPNPYGAHPGAGWAPPRSAGTGKGRITRGRVIAAAVGSLLVFVYVVIPAVRLLF